MTVQIKPYKKNFEYGYSFGVYPTMELLENRQENVIKIMAMEKGLENEGVQKIIKKCRQENIAVEIADKAINRISKKENNYTVGVFRKYTEHIRPGNHLVLVNPSDMGNMGTIIRTALGFKVQDMAIIRPGVDVFDPKVVRSSMGAIFKIRCQYFDSFEDYQEAFPENNVYTFMLNADNTLTDTQRIKSEPYSLVFGNEGSGLDESYFVGIGNSIKIEQSNLIDSLNLSIAVGIALYEFNRK